MSYAPEQLAPILEAATKAGFILVGGQAVNSWSQKFHYPGNEPWKTLSPFTSEDVDCYAVKRSLPVFIQELESKGFSVSVMLPDNERESIYNVALVEIAGQGLDIGINCLRDVIGVSAQELKDTAQRLAVAGTTLLAMHPLLCVESKTHNLIRLDQAERQDEKPLRLSIANLNLHLKETAETASFSTSQQIAHRIRELAFSSSGTWIFRNYTVNFFDSLPLAAWSKTGAGPDLQGLSTEMLESFRELENDIQKDVASEEWLRKANPNPYKRRKNDGTLTRYPELSSKVKVVSDQIVIDAGGISD